MLNNFEIYSIDELISGLLRDNANHISITYLNKCFDNEEYMFAKIFFDYLSTRYAKTNRYTDEPKLFAHSGTRDALRNISFTEISASLYQECVNEIDDYLEYQYKFHCKEEVRANVMIIIDKMTEKIKKRNEQNTKVS